MQLKSQHNLFVLCFLLLTRQLLLFVLPYISLVPRRSEVVTGVMSQRGK